MNRLEVLKKCDLFCELNDEQLGVVEQLCTAVMFEPGANICKQHQKQDRIHVIEEGLAGIVLEVGPLSQRQVQSASKFDVVGWSGMVDPHICTATVKAIEKTKVLSFDAQGLCNLCFDKPELGCRVCRGLARVVAGRLHQAYTQLLGVTSQD